MTNFCESCAEPLGSGSKFCGKCGAAVSLGAAPASEVRPEIRAGVRSLPQPSAMRVPKPIWAGVIEIFWIIQTAGAFIVYTGLFFVLAVASSVVSAMPTLAARSAAAQQFVLWIGAAAVFTLVQLCFQLPIAIGFFQLKRWAYGLYMWTIAPFIAFWLILEFALWPIEEPASMAVTLARVVSVAITGLQFFLVLRGKDEMVN